ncbi:MAG: hypothetical protein AAF404_11800 [Pseudomonadota bacterium]
MSINLLQLTMFTNGMTSGILLSIGNVVRQMGRSLGMLLVSLVAAMPFTSVSATTVVVSNERSGDLIFMDENGETLSVVPLCSRPRGMAQHRTAGVLFVACSDDGHVVEFDVTTQQTLRVFAGLTGAMSLAFHEPTSRLIISNEGVSKATVLDTQSGDVLAELPTGHEPDGVALSTDGRLIFVASENAGLVHVFDSQTYQPAGRLITHLRPRRLAVRQNELWVSSEMGSRVEIFDTTTLAKSDEIVFAPRGFRSEQLTPVDILFNQSGNTAFVALGSANHLVIVDAVKREIIKYILVGRRPWGLGLTADGKRLFVLNGLSDDMTIIDVSKRRPVRTSRTGLVPHSVEIFH